ncbi:carboxypeptidase-like regulatory domain-containing protein [Alistipes sp.]|uniref:carboxypeptidase-like regulatory domain-containing protein n=1 Tax=Alistipes sp. TaxID=1872444 RepID=UPI003AEF7ED5
MKKTLLIVLAIILGMAALSNTVDAQQMRGTEISASVSQQIKVTGRVTDSNGDGIPGVNIRIKGSTVGTVTDADGNFTIYCNVGDILVFTFIGYKPLEIVVRGGSIEGVLVPDTQSIDEIF